MKKYVLVPALCLLLTLSLSAQQPTTVWFYRPASDNSNLTPTVYQTSGAGSRRLATLGRGEFFGLPMNPGIYAFSWTNAPARGEQTYVAVAADQQGFVEVLSRSMKTVSATVAFQQMNGIVSVPPQNIFDAAVMAPTEIQLPSNVASSPVGTSAAPLSARVATQTAVAQRERINTEALNAPRMFEIFWAPYSFSRQGELNLHGGDLSLAIKGNDRISIIADASAHRRERAAAVGRVAAASDFWIYTYRFGPKFTYRPNNRVTLFSQTLAGGTHITAAAAVVFGNTFAVASGVRNGLAFASGGGMDLALKPWLGIRVFQAEYSTLHIAEGWSSGVRLGGGLMFRIR